MTASEISPLLRPHQPSGNSASPQSKPWMKAVLMIMLASVLCVLNVASFRSESVPESIIEEHYDVIVVGGGPAGSVVASQLLAKSPSLSVLLIEAGDATQSALGGTFHSSFTDTSLPTHWTPFDVPFYWSHVAHLEAFHWNVSNTFIAKALGGCGIHNAMLYVRALPEDILAWNMAPIWTWDVAQAIYIATEDYDGPKNLPHHGYHGRVRTTRPKLLETASAAFVAGCAQAGLPQSEDFNAPNGRFGVGYYDFNIRNGVRDSAAMTFLKPLLTTPSPRFRLRLNTLVEKVNIDDKHRAVSVNIRTSTSISSIIHATEAIVLTAGAIHTPKLLTLSGIASKNVLADLDIPVVVDLPLVGNNLQDHPAIALLFQAQTPLDINFTTAWEDYIHRAATGWLSTPGLAAGAFLVPPGSTAPQLQLTFFPRNSEPQWTNASNSQLLFTIALLAPEARNRVVVTSKHMDIPVQVTSEIPQVASEHLTPVDAYKLVYGIRVVREIAASLAMQEVVGAEVMPGEGKATDEELLEWVYTSVYRNSHWVGSAKMGTTADNGVVNQRLQVLNVSRLYVADASVIPIIPNGNVHSTVVMVASHAATLIAQDLAAP
ncbi:hypothetical protein, variant 1 [Aphanomyces astaci]|uniref:Glucose-methanol-choline oxidoreductase N-terminal domain-containing protein n=1 Tax=Aphanomyces astaci TaxID=112090 RepID=W4FIR8_APHAT|nr:hypothetical protein, variant 1 [Aphanomyces astaci]ETV66613.1 hypothetical protein, variant 1 [Aphanomyces astaci]|eukprot:XP_009843985.1 hypothetical protein, variant 1 [Aphanomyces astaci]